MATPPTPGAGTGPAGRGNLRTGGRSSGAGTPSLRAGRGGSGGTGGRAGIEVGSSTGAGADGGGVGAEDGGGSDGREAGAGSEAGGGGAGSEAEGGGAGADAGGGGTSAGGDGGRTSGTRVAISSQANAKRAARLRVCGLEGLGSTGISILRSNSAFTLLSCS